MPTTPSPQALDQLPSLLDANALAACFGVERNTIYNWAKRGVIPAIRVSGRLRFNPSTVSRLMQHGLGSEASAS